MLLTISIISGIMFFVYFLSVLLGEKEGNTNILTYGAILILSVWFQNETLGIVFLCIVCFMAMISIISYISNN